MHIILEGNGNEFENVEIITAISDFIYSTGRFINFNNYLTTNLTIYKTFSSVTYLSRLHFTF